MQRQDVDWNESPLQRWLGSITRDGTAKLYKTAFRRFSEHTGMTATQLIDEAIEDMKKDPREKKDIVTSRLIGFYKYLKKDYERHRRGNGEHGITGTGLSDSLALTYVNAVRSFYATFDVVVKMKGRKSLPAARIENRRMKVSAEPVNILVEHTRNPRDSAIILTMFQSGMDVSTLCSIKASRGLMEAIEKGEAPIKLDLQRPKTGVNYYTFIGKDAVKSIKIYLQDLKSRGIKLGYNDPLFVKEKRSGEGVEELETNLIQNMLKDVAVKSGFVDEKLNGKAINPLSPHALRESFGSIMINSGVPDTIVDFWLGHRIGEMSEAYKSVQYESLRKMYMERENLLSITKPTTDLEKIRKEVEKTVKEDIEGESKKLQTLVNGLAIENIELKDSMKSLKEQVEALTEQFSDLSKGMGLNREEVVELIEWMLKEKDKLEKTN